MPLIVPLIISGVGSVISNVVKSHQASKAISAQQTATDKAMALQQQANFQNQQTMAPYQQAGQMTLGRLGQMAAQAPSQFNPSNYSGGAPTQAFQQSQSQQPQQSGPMDIPAPQWPGGAGMPSTSMPGQSPLGPPPGAPMPGQSPGGQGDTVTIQTPDGRTLQGFPRARVQEAMQRGAKVIG